MFLNFLFFVLLRDIQGIRTSCKLVPELVEKYLEEIHQLLIQAIEKPLSELNDEELNSDESLQNKRAISSSLNNDIKRTKLISET